MDLLSLEGYFYYVCTHKHTHTHVYSAATSQLHNYTNLMPHSPLLIPYSVHIFILALNEGAATCFTPNKSRVRFILHLRQCGWWWSIWCGGCGVCVCLCVVVVVVGRGFMHGHNPAPEGRPPLPAASHN